jgi:hypothetical protein
MPLRDRSDWSVTDVGFRKSQYVEDRQRVRPGAHSMESDAGAHIDGVERDALDHRHDAYTLVELYGQGGLLGIAVPVPTVVVHSTRSAALFARQFRGSADRTQQPGGEHGAGAPGATLERQRLRRAGRLVDPAGLHGVGWMAGGLHLGLCGHVDVRSLGRGWGGRRGSQRSFPSWAPGWHRPPPGLETLGDGRRGCDRCRIQAVQDRIRHRSRHGCQPLAVKPSSLLAAMTYWLV